MALLTEIAAQLPPRTGGPRSDETTTAAAELAADVVRALQQAAREPGGLTQPATVAVVAGQAADVAHALSQICGQLAGWLYREYGAAVPGMPVTADGAVRHLHTAAWSADRASRTLDRVQATAARLPRTGAGR